jgi:hypothetical protein
MIMILRLHKLRTRLCSRDELIQRQWRWLFDGWVTAEATSAHHSADITLALERVRALPPLPAERPFFSDAATLPDQVGILSVYRGEGKKVWLHYLDGALIETPLEADGEETLPVATGVVVKKALAYGRFEDITFTTLAPLLRRRGYYLLHAFAASKDGRCVLLVGPSGSGKTTAGLSLLLDGWRLLANDILLLEERPDGVYALPTPGGVSIRARTVALLPDLARLLPAPSATAAPFNLTGQQLVNGCWSEPQRVTAVYFPQVVEGSRSAVTEQKRAVCLARLMAESIDRWDEAMIPGHVNLLQRLCRQVRPYELRLGRDVAQLSRLIGPAIARE